MGGQNPKMQDQTRLLPFPRPFIFGMHSRWGFNLHIKSYIEPYIVGKRSLVGAKVHLASAKRFLILFTEGLLWNPLILMHFQPAFRFERQCCPLQCWATMVNLPLRSEGIDLDLTLRRKSHKAKPCIHESQNHGLELRGLTYYQE